MREYVERTLLGESLVDCDSAAPELPPPDAPRMPNPALQALADIPEKRWTNGKPELAERIVLVILASSGSPKGAEQAEQDFRKYREIQSGGRGSGSQIEEPDTAFFI